MKASNKLNTVGLSAHFPREESFAKVRMVKVTFSKKLLERYKLANGSALSFKIESNALVLRYENKGDGVIQVGIPMARLRISNSGVLTISEKRLPELFRYNLSTKVQRVGFKIENACMVIDLSQLKQAESVSTLGFGNVAKEEPAEEEVIGFGRCCA